MGQIKGKGKNYSPWDLLKLVVGGVKESAFAKVDMVKAKKEWESLSKTEQKELLDVMVMESLAGVGGNVKLSGPLKKSAGVLKHTLEDRTLRKSAKELGIDVGGTQDVSGKLVKELEEGFGPGSNWKKKIERMFLSSAPLSPETMYALEKTGAGRKIYRTIDLADQGMNKFQVREISKFQKALGGIKGGSRSSRRIGRVLDGKLDVSQLTKEEKRLHDFLKDKFDFLINKYARSTLGSDKRYKKIAGAASTTKKPMVDVKDLDRGLKSQYNKIITVKNLFLQKFGGNSVSNLSKKNKKLFERMQESLDEIRHKGWVKTLDQTERETYLLLKRKIKNYLPHIFDRDELLKGLSVEQQVLQTALGKATGVKEISKLKRRLVSVEGSINKLKGGGLITYEHLPQNLRFKFFDTRKGAQGYSFDSVKAYEGYLRGISKKIYQEPAVRQVKELYKDLSPEYRQYVTKHVKDWLGMGRTGAMEAADVVASVQWMLKLGMNPRSAITNFAQRVNTLAEVGEKNAIKGYLKGWTKEGNELFKSTGIAQEVPSVLMEGKVPEGLERFKNILGWMFTKIEIGNRKGAFLAGVEQAKSLGLKGQEAIQHGIDVVHKTQFRYGQVGLPAPLRTAPGKLGMQFWSYPIKQVEFLTKLLVKNPMKLLKWVVYAEGGRELLEEKAGVDMGNALGLGFNWGELVEAAKQVPKGNWDNFFKHIRLMSSGGGLVPGYSPTVGAVVDISRGIGKGKGLEALGRELVPVQAGKMSRLYKGVKGAQRVGDTWELPWYDKAGRLDVELSPGEAITETFGPRLSKLSNLNLEKSKVYELDQLKKNLTNEMNEAQRVGDWDKAEEIAGRILSYGNPAERDFERTTPWEIRQELGKTPQDYAVEEALE